MSRKACVDVEVGGLTLGLQYRSVNQMELQRLTGLDPVAFLEKAAGKPSPSADLTDERARKAEIVRRGLHMSSLEHTVPLIIAGLAHDEHYAGVSDADMRRRICGLIDAEAEKRGEVALTVAATLANTIMPAFQAAVIPPGKAVDGTSDEKATEGAPAPLAEAAAPSVGTA